MKYNILYPGAISDKEVILVSGVLPFSDMLSACQSIAEGVESKGFTVSVCTTARPPHYSRIDQHGDPLTWDYDFDVLIVCLGQYFQDEQFRYGRITNIPITRILFFSHVATPYISYTVDLKIEIDHRSEVLKSLSDKLPGIISLVSPNLLERSMSELALAATDSEAIQYLLKGEVVPAVLLDERENLFEQAGIDRSSDLERTLW